MLHCLWSFDAVACGAISLYCATLRGVSPLSLIFSLWSPLNWTLMTYQLALLWSVPVQLMPHSSAQIGLQFSLRVILWLTWIHWLTPMGFFLDWFMRCIYITQKTWPILSTSSRKCWWAWKMESWGPECWALKMTFWQWSNLALANNVDAQQFIAIGNWNIFVFWCYCSPPCCMFDSWTAWIGYWKHNVMHL